MLGKVVTMKPAALQKKRENKNTVALDSEQNAIQVYIIDFRINGIQLPTRILNRKSKILLEECRYRYCMVCYQQEYLIF